MNLDIWLTFIIATVILTLLPGPTMLLVIGHALVAGPKKAFITVTGVILADCTLVFLSLVGVGAVLSSSVLAFNIMKWLGVVYLIYMGINQWRDNSSGITPPENIKKESSKRMFFQGFITTLLNPKAIGFFIAFLPQFIMAEQPMYPQLMVLVSTFIFVVYIILGGYCLLAGQSRVWFKSSKSYIKMNKVSGATFIGAGLITATLQQSS
jgi:homoserine/homoserine lactone efflux protein